MVTRGVQCVSLEEGPSRSTAGREGVCELVAKHSNRRGTDGRERRLACLQCTVRPKRTVGWKLEELEHVRIAARVRVASGICGRATTTP